MSPNNDGSQTFVNAVFSVINDLLSSGESRVTLVMNPLDRLLLILSANRVRKLVASRLQDLHHPRRTQCFLDVLSLRRDMTAPLLPLTSHFLLTLLPGKQVRQPRIQPLGRNLPSLLEVIAQEMIKSTKLILSLPCLLHPCPVKLLPP